MAPNVHLICGPSCNFIMSIRCDLPIQGDLENLEKSGKLLLLCGTIVAL